MNHNNETQLYTDPTPKIACNGYLFKTLSVHVLKLLKYTAMMYIAKHEQTFNHCCRL